MSQSTRPARPVLRYHGGKYVLADWIISHFPAHRVYTEVFGGAGSVLLAKPRAYAEVYNDLDSEVVNLFRVLRDPAQAKDLENVLRLTPFSREEFQIAHQVATDPIEKARRTIIRAFMSFGADGVIAKTPLGFRNDTKRPGGIPAHEWANYPDAIPSMVGRLRGVVIETVPSVEVLLKHDSPLTLHYVDPPYPHESRPGGKSPKHPYRHEMTENNHAELARVLHELCGMVVLSGYACDLYSDLFGDWRKVERKALADGARERTEVLWLNPAAAAKQPQMSMESFA